MKPINIQTVDAEIERLEQATSLTPREEFHLAVFRKMFEYLSAETKCYDVYEVDERGTATFRERILTAPLVAQQNCVYIPLIERP